LDLEQKRELLILALEKRDGLLSPKREARPVERLKREARPVERNHGSTLGWAGLG